MGARMVVQDCNEADDNTDARDKLFMVAVPEYDPSASSAARESASLLAAAERHLGGLLAELDAALPSLPACGFAASLVARVSQSVTATQEHGSRRMTTKANKREDAASAAVSSIASKLGVDKEATEVLIAKARSLISKVSR